MWNQLKQPGSFRSLIALVGGTVFAIGSVMLQRFQPHVSVMDKGQPPSNGSSIFLWMWQAQALLARTSSWPWILPLFLACAGFAIHQRNKEKGWIAAMMAGMAFVSLLFQLIQKFT
jgi:hypothetical protein